MSKNNSIIESMYAKYADMTDVQKKRRNLKEGYEEEGPQTDDTIEEYSAGAMKSDWGQAGLIISKRPDGWYYLILGEKFVGPFKSMQEAISQCRKDNPDKELVNLPRYANETKLHISKTYPAPLDEARNPENDEINKVIARTAGRRSISPEDKKALQDAGIHRGRGGLLTGKGGREVTGFQDKIYGPSKKGWPFGWDRDNYGDVDFKNYLDKPINNDKWAHDYDSVKALHPYTRGYKEYGGVVDRYNDEKATQEYQNAYHKEQTGRDYLSDEDIEAQAQEYKQELIKKREARANKLANLEQKKHDYVAKAKEQHAAKKKNESLSLKESMFGYSRINEIIDFLADMGYDDEDEACAVFLSVLLNFVTEDQVNQAMEEVTDYVEG